MIIVKWAPSSEFVSSSIPSWPILTAHAQPFRGARGLAFCLKVPLDSLLVWASSEGSGETARMSRLTWTFAARIGYKYQIRLTRSKWLCIFIELIFLYIAGKWQNVNCWIINQILVYLVALHLSRDMTKPTKWLWAQQWLRSALASRRSDQSVRCALNG